MKYVLICLTLCSCGALSSAPGQSGQAEAARAAEQSACNKFLARFREGRSDNLSCEQAKARAEAENPTCMLVFTCKDANND